MPAPSLGSIATMANSLLMLFTATFLSNYEYAFDSTWHEIGQMKDGRYIKRIILSRQISKTPQFLSAIEQSGISAPVLDRK